MNTALEYSTRVVHEGGRRCKKSILNDLVHLTPLRIPLMNPPVVAQTVSYMIRLKTAPSVSDCNVSCRESWCKGAPSRPFVFISYKMWDLPRDFLF